MTETGMGVWFRDTDGFQMQIAVDRQGEVADTPF
jgi:hypothetical protein